MKLKYLLLLVLMLIGLISYVVDRHFKLKSELKRVQSNYSEVVNENEILILKKGELSQQVTQLRLTRDEFREEIKSALDSTTQDLKSQLKQLNIKLSNVTAVGNTEIITYDSITNIQWRDTLVYNTIPLRTAEIKTEWNDVNIISHGDSLDVTFSIRNQLTQVFHKIPRIGIWNKIIFRPWKRKISQQIISSNPRSKILYSKFIEIE